MTDSRRWLWLAGVFLCGWLIYLLTPILSPFLVAMLLAYMGDPMVDRLERRGLPRTWGVVIVFALFSLLLLVMLLVLIPMLGRQLVRLYELLPQGLDWAQHQALPWLQAQLGLAEGFWRFDQLKQALSGHLGKTTDIVSGLLAQATASGLALLGWLGNLLLIPVVAFYLLREEIYAIYDRWLGVLGTPGPLLGTEGGDSDAVLAEFRRAGVDLDALAAKLQDEGAAAFVASWHELLGVVASKSRAIDGA